MRLLTTQAIHQATGLSLETDLLYCSHEVEVQGLLPYYVALDRERQEVCGGEARGGEGLLLC